MPDHLGTAILAAGPFVYSDCATLQSFDSWNGNYITNSDAETGSPPTGWAAVTNCTIATDTTQHASGAASVKVTATAAGDVVLRCPISAFPLNANQWHHAGINVISPTISRNASHIIRYYNSTPTLLASAAASASFATSTSAWTYVWKDSNQINNGSVVNISIELTIAGCAAGEIHYVDAAIVNNGKYGQDYFTSVPDTIRPMQNGPLRGNKTMTSISVYQSNRLYDIGTPTALLATDDFTIEQAFSTTDAGFNFLGSPSAHLLWQNIGYLWNSYMYLAPKNGLAGDTIGLIGFGNKDISIDRGYIYAPIQANDGNIHHIVATSTGSSCITYVWVDGIKYGPVTSYRGDTYADQNAFFSAAGSFGWTGFNGYLGHHAQYKRILTDDEIRNHAALALAPGYKENLVLAQDRGYVSLRSGKVYNGSTWVNINQNQLRVYDGSKWI